MNNRSRFFYVNDNGSEKMPNMKRIGIVAVTTVGASICANEIVAASARCNKGSEHPEFVMHAFSFDRYKKLVVAEDWNGVADLILEAINQLKKLEMDMIIIPSNTPHYGISRIQEKSPLPVLNLIEITSDECRKLGYQKVAILGTKSTVMGGLYNKALRDRGIEPIIVDEKICDVINHLIMDEIIPLKPTRQGVADHIALNFLKHIQCDAFALACTELPDVYNQINLGKPVIDTTRLLAIKAVEVAMNNNLENKIISRL